MPDISDNVVHLLRLLAEGTPRDTHEMARRIVRQVARDRPDLAAEAEGALARMKASPGFARRAGTPTALPIPIDEDSRLELLRSDEPQAPDVVPRWPAAVEDQLERVMRERAVSHRLLAEGLSPTNSLLFVGAPGVGKTLAAREMARRMGRVLLTLDLAAVMSSYLGRTGNNIRAVLDYAAAHPCVLLLDEFDAIAKRRDDAAELGELKRLVNVLLQAIDSWPADGLLIAATNHPELLDPAVWRRFDAVVQFPLPSSKDAKAAVAAMLDPGAVSDEVIDVLANSLGGRPYSEIQKLINAARREAITTDEPLETALLGRVTELVSRLPTSERIRIAQQLETVGHSQRRVQALTGVSRQTLRKYKGKAS